jgi:hypothetical protein
MMADLDRPIPESYWVIPSRLLAGEYPGLAAEKPTRKRIDAFIESGFQTFIDLTQPNELASYVRILTERAKAYSLEVSYQRFPIGDFGLPTPEQMNVILDAIDESLEAGQKIYLHCWGGIGRTGTTVGCYLVRQGMSGVAALTQLAAWWKSVPKSRYHLHSPETVEQMNFVRNWAAYDYKLPKADH